MISYRDFDPDIASGLFDFKTCGYAESGFRIRFKNRKAVLPFGVPMTPGENLQFRKNLVLLSDQFFELLDRFFGEEVTVVPYKQAPFRKEDKKQVVVTDERGFLRDVFWQAVTKQAFPLWINEKRTVALSVTDSLEIYVACTAACHVDPIPLDRHFELSEWVK